ncbi:glycosyltransferase family 87 protein [soil metagenome]
MLTPSPVLKAPAAAPAAADSKGFLGAAWTLALLSFLVTVLEAVDGNRYDISVVWRAAGRLIAAEPLYVDGAFLYPPGAALLFAPLAALSVDAAVLTFLVINALLLPLAVVVCLRVLGFSWRGLAAALLLLGLSRTETVRATLALGNVNFAIFLGEACFLLGLVRGRYLLAGVALGITLAVKPVLAPLLLLAVLLRAWKAVGAAVGTAVAVTAVALPFVADRLVFVTEVLPHLVGNSRVGHNHSLFALGRLYGLPDAVTITTRLLALATAGVAVWLLWRWRRVDLGLWACATSGVVLLGTFLAAGLGQMYYAVYLAPLVLTVARPHSPMRAWPAWVGVFVANFEPAWTFGWLPDSAVALLPARPALGWAMLLVTVTVVAARRGPPAGAAPPAARPVRVKALAGDERGLS